MNANVLDRLALLKADKKKIEDEIDQISEKLVKEMNKSKVKTIENDRYRATLVAEQVKVTNTYDAEKLAEFCKRKGFHISRFKKTNTKRTKEHIQFTSKKS